MTVGKPSTSTSSACIYHLVLTAQCPHMVFRSLPRQAPRCIGAMAVRKRTADSWLTKYQIYAFVLVSTYDFGAWDSLSSIGIRKARRYQ